MIFFVVFFLFYQQGAISDVLPAPVNPDITLDVANKTLPHDLTRDEWIQIAMETQIDGAFDDDSAIKRVCGAAKWHEDRVISCDTIRGGIGIAKYQIILAWY